VANLAKKLIDNLNIGLEASMDENYRLSVTTHRLVRIRMYIETV
jgi:hypothetical protein